MLLAVGAVYLTGWQWLDPMIAVAVAVNILWTGFRLIRRSAAGLMDSALPRAERAQLAELLARFQARRRRLPCIAIANRRAAAVHLGASARARCACTVKQGHDMAVRFESEITAMWERATVLVHVEPVEEPGSYDDIAIDRRAARRLTRQCPASGRPGGTHRRLVPRSKQAP